MVRNAETLLEEALRLPAAERSEVAMKLFDSLDDSPDSELDASWDEEIRRRIDDIESGREVPIPHEQAMRMIFGDLSSDDN
jgi:putative addiction module component (TIGR02574 family)